MMSQEIEERDIDLASDLRGEALTWFIHERGFRDEHRAEVLSRLTRAHDGENSLRWILIQYPSTLRWIEFNKPKLAMKIDSYF